MRVDLGGWLSPHSLLRRCGRPLADALLRAWLEPMLLSVVMLRDKVRVYVCGVMSSWCVCVCVMSSCVLVGWLVQLLVASIVWIGRGADAALHADPKP